MMKLFGLLLLCVSLAYGLLFSRLDQEQNRTTQIEQPRAAQTQTGSNQTESVNIKLRGIDGKTYDTALMRGSVLLVSFGATWCVPCKDELLALEELKKEYKDKPVKFLWVSIDDEGDKSDGDLRSYAKRYRLTFPVLRDTTRLTFAQFTQRVRLPMVVFYDRDGQIVPPTHFGMSGSPDIYKNRMRARLNQILETQAAASPVSGN